MSQSKHPPGKIYLRAAPLHLLPQQRTLRLKVMGRPTQSLHLMFIPERIFWMHAVRRPDAETVKSFETSTLARRAQYLAALDPLLQQLQLVVALLVGPDDGGPPPKHLGQN